MKLIICFFLESGKYIPNYNHRGNFFVANNYLTESGWEFFENYWIFIFI